ncbi:putative F-box/LRR-repeat protein 23 [Lycium barbarum]|uniref:putative F-box/LRR-repeat protein 23 n=1 Tax=Lycium barbarum TaxID=112863 RepID=UPI00293E31FF|nr:putative F-box/LRR-repeat protein 23 [Lycium barbarum]
MVCDGLVKAVKKLPLLEELSLTHTDITTEGIEALGRSCPRLKLFEMNECYTGHYLDLNDDSDEDDNSDKDDDPDEGDIRNNMALAIAKNLPALHHLQLIGNWMTTEGLEAILDGCPNLVSLDLRQCLKVSFNEVLSSRISQQIKDVKYPHDSLAGCKFSFESPGNAVDEYNMYDDYYFGF